MIDLTPIVNALIAVAAAAATAFLIPWIKTKTTEQQRKDIAAWVKIAVAAAEQIYTGQGRGAEKKAYVIDFLNKNNLKIDTAAIDAMIEAAVQQLNSSVGLTIE